MDYFKKYQEAVYGGALAVGLGYLSGKVVKKQIIPVANAKEAIMAFILVTAAGIGGSEIKTKYPYKGE